MNLHDVAQWSLEISLTVSLVVLSLAFLITVTRIVMGPTLPDRVLGLDMLTSVAIGFIAVIGIDTGFTLYIDIAIALGLVGFLATVAFARFIMARGKTEEERMEQLRAGANATSGGEPL
ncbi:MAG TPA: cation:proton antiporter [Aurantimonas sp.]|uniref:Cation:proton antiporter n=1 Tax=Aurantimonas marianensis TaxID=2920428 RepID=A0A9X2H8Z9_9HYPH|nr:cation:proton antiporter [Aurantimonas marianensis]MCP3055993.1 cation:proton antiporter [Aurantimonas marianensis]